MLAVLLSQHNPVTAVDIIPSKVDLINSKRFSFVDIEIEGFFLIKELNLVATMYAYGAYKDTDFVIISTPTNYDEKLELLRYM